MSLSDPNVILQHEYQYLEDKKNQWTAHANAEVTWARSNGQDVHFVNVCWGDGACLYYSFCDQIQRPEIVDQNLQHFKWLNEKAKGIYSNNDDARRKFHGTVTNASPIDQAMVRRQHSVYNPDFPNLTPWSLRQLVCDYVQAAWTRPNIPEEMKTKRENLVITVNENRRSQKTFDQIVNDQREPCEWSWEFFILAASEAMRTPIWLMTTNAKPQNPYPLRFDNPEVFGSTPMLISFARQHFQSLRPGRNPSVMSLRPRQTPISPQVQHQSTPLTTQSTSNSKL